MRYARSVRTLVAIGALWVISCTHQRPQSELDTLAGRRVTVQVTGSPEPVDAIADRTAEGVVFHTESGQLISQPMITQVAELHRGRGAAEGAGLGFAVGFTVGAATGYIAATRCDQDPNCWNFPGTPAATVIIGALFGMVGAAGGAIIGVAIGSHDVYSYRERPRLTLVGPPGSVGGVTITW